ncbi:MAG: hypothetical protein AMJ94_19195 [Deltaproteobacteria bacterium SM23_61]|nr:MAG: hypothetical protein AMJ94_19195 [Deltaproteobacteria bacterium SM23_61]
MILRFECRITRELPPILFGRKGQGLKRNVDGKGKSWLFLALGYGREKESVESNRAPERK